MLNLTELRTFSAAAETENFSEAARRLGITQPSVSMQIRSLEKALGARLFDRSGRAVRLTDVGRTLVPLARDLLERSIHLEETISSLEGEVIGLLTIGCTTAAGKYVVPKLLAGLRGRHPRVEVVCHVTTRRQALDLLRDGEAQIAITSLKEPARDIEYRPFATDRIVLISPPDHPWALREGPITPGELGDGQFIRREEGSGTLAALKDALAWHDLSIDDLPTLMTLGNSEAIWMAVAEGLGVAFVSSMVAAPPAAMGSIAIVDVAGLQLSRTLYMARDVARPASRAQSAFWDYAFSPESEAVRRRPSLIPGPG
jgi:DNA-binding transcriptional LysR family regulator